MNMSACKQSVGAKWFLVFGLGLGIGGCDETIPTEVVAGGPSSEDVEVAAVASPDFMQAGDQVTLHLETPIGDYGGGAPDSRVLWDVTWDPERFEYTSMAPAGAAEMTDGDPVFGWMSLRQTSFVEGGINLYFMALVDGSTASVGGEGLVTPDESQGGPGASGG